MDKGYQKIFWGLFIVSFNITLGIIKILPAFIGWMVILSGINFLYKEFKSESLKVAAKYSRNLIALSLIGGALSLFGGSSINSSIVFTYYPIILMILELVMAYKILEGSIEYLRLENLDEIAIDFEKNLRTYIVFYVIFTLSFCVALSFNMGYLLTITAIFALILRISLMAMINRMKKMDFISDGDQTVIGQEDK